MRLADIEVGGRYGASVNLKQIETIDGEPFTLPPGPYGADSFQRRTSFRHAGYLIDVTIVGIETVRGRRCLRVRGTLHTKPEPVPRKEYVEDHGDGTYTWWQGYVYRGDAAKFPYDGGEREPMTEQDPGPQQFEAVISPQQIRATYEDAVVHAALDSARYRAGRTFEGVTWEERGGETG